MNIPNFSFVAESMDAAAIPVSGTPATTAQKPMVQNISFGDDFVPIPIDTVLRPACGISTSLSFGDLYSSLVCIDHKSDVTSVFVSTGTAFYASHDTFKEGVPDFRVYILVSSLMKAMSLAGTHIGVNATDISLGFWDLVVPIQPITDSADLRKHFEVAEQEYDFKFELVDFPFQSIPQKILGLYSASLVTLQKGGIVWYSTEHKHFVKASFPYDVALHITVAQVLRTLPFKSVYLEGDRLFLKSDTFLLCVPTFKIDEALFSSTFSVPDLDKLSGAGGYTAIAPVQVSTLLRSSELFSGSVRFVVSNNGSDAHITASIDGRQLFSVPLMLADPAVTFDFSVTADSLFDVSSVNALGQNFLSSSSGVCIFF